MNYEYDYEIEVTYLGVDYLVYANLYKDGEYSVIPQAWDDPGGYEIIEDPKFHNFTIMDTLTELEVSPQHGKEVLYITVEILKNVYWSKEIN